MFNLVEFRDCLERAVSLLRSCEIRFLITGGAAAIAYGDPRTTQDIDLVIEATAIQERLEQFVDNFGKRNSCTMSRPSVQLSPPDDSFSFWIRGRP